MAVQGEGSVFLWEGRSQEISLSSCQKYLGGCGGLAPRVGRGHGPRNRI